MDVSFVSASTLIERGLTFDLDAENDGNFAAEKSFPLSFQFISGEF